METTTDPLLAQRWIRDTDRPVISLGAAGDFDDMHIFAPCVAWESGTYSMWYCGSRAVVAERIFTLGYATSKDGVHFTKHPASPVCTFNDSSRSILTPTILRHPDGTLCREAGKLRMWFSSCDFPSGDTRHTLHQTVSDNGIQWDAPSPEQLAGAYAPTIIKDDHSYRMWYTDVQAEPWSFRYAQSNNGIQWDVHPDPVLQLDQDWEHQRLFYPTVLVVDHTYCMWYGSYSHQPGQAMQTALGFAQSDDGIHWRKSPGNPVFGPDPSRPWESHYTTSQSIHRTPGGAWRIWYASRPAPPFEHKYFAINTAQWTGTLADHSPPDAAANQPAFTQWQATWRNRLAITLGLPQQRVALAAESRGQLQHDDLMIEKWIFTAEPGSRLPAVLYRPQTVAEIPMPAIVLTFGHGGSKSHPEYLYIAQAFAKLGILCLAIDPIGEEERHKSGALGTRAHDPYDVHTCAWNAGRPIMGKFVWDTMRGIDFLLERNDVDPGRIGVAGNSLGGAKAGWMAVLDTRLHCALISGWAFGLATELYGKFCTKVPNSLMRQSLTWKEYLALAAPHCNIRITNGHADPVIDCLDDGSAWHGTDQNVTATAAIYATLGNSNGIQTWYETGGGHRPYPARKANLQWLLDTLKSADHYKAKLETAHEINFGDWCRTYDIPLEPLYGTPLHLQGATVADLGITPIPRERLAVLKPDELGKDEFTIEGWLENIQ